MASLIDAFHNAFYGERVFIIGTGPSLDKVTDRQLGALSGEYTFGVNTLLTYERLPFAPDFYCVAESGWLTDISIPNVIERLKTLSECRFYCHHWPLAALEGQGWHYVKYDSDKRMQDREFMGLGEELPYVTSGASVAMFAVQLACWMGFDRVYLLGCDATRQGHADGLGLGAEDAVRLRQDSFIRSANEAEGIMGKEGRRLVNLTEGGALKISRGDLGKVLKEG